MYSQKTVLEPTAHWLFIVIALTADGLRTRRLNSVTLADRPQTAEQTRDFNKELPFILNFGMIGWKACPRCLSDGLLTTIEDKQNNQRNFLFTIDHWLLISLKDSNMQATVTMKNSVFIKLCLVWAIRPIWWMGWYDLIVGVWPDLT